MASSNEITAFNDWYEGDDTVQNLDMLAGDDAVIARGGNDIINGNAGKDVLDGGAGNDTLDGGADNDRLFGAGGDDVLIGGEGNDMLAAGDGNDDLSGGAGVDVLRGGRGDDYLKGNDGDDFIQGDRGADTLEGGLGFDTYLFRYQDDPAPGVTPITTIVDSDDAGGNAVRFLGGLDADDITLINDRDTGDLEIQYGHHENTILSSIHVANSADGEVISEFQFSDGTIIGFEALCASQSATCEIDDLIFESGFEQVMVNLITAKDLPIDTSVVGSDVLGPFALLPLLAALLLSK